MLVFPQLLSGALAQFPVRRRLAFSNITNLQEDGSKYRSEDGPIEVRWTLSYEHLTSPEAITLRTFYESTRGRLLSFSFFDPLANLLAWSEDLVRPVWEKSPLVNAMAVDQNGLAVTRLSWPSAGAIQVSQTLAIPESALTCFSLYARADQPGTINLSTSDAMRTILLTNSWTQYFVTQAGGAAAEKTVMMSLTGGSVEVSRLMVSAQPSPAVYIPSQAAGGVMPQTRFDQDSLTIQALGQNDFSCQIQLTSRLT